MPPRPTRTYELAALNAGYTTIAGVDEVGMGALAGPVVAGAVIFHPNTRIPNVRDSKTLSSIQREQLAQLIYKKSTAWAVGEASVEEITTLNIRQASHLAMRRALEALAIPPDFILIDGSPIKNFPWPNQNIIDGDRKVFTIAAASIIAKVHRDRLLSDLDQQYPGYGFAKHKGYGVPQHLTALKNFGPCVVHRLSYTPVLQSVRIG